ncbi:predicted protein [Aspergillus terreus NIH2624]|uniref:Pentatricopeptide repeat protein n=1 Tax=Aspergillus terreus (strain NIH 2624 / FGSC A1156) TaxID=341663 RepID=Q0CW26_ASPTN|nr:uncharacterized protein ATEG_02108 [Aspergillus terreus NIH2624]EAU37070.1 predicted protein [Aspergillus terreus NIH2624]
MQRLWSRAAPAQSSCRCVSCLSTGASGITSRAASAASKRRLRIGNSVTALYTSIFAAAALADAQAKDRRRLEWKEKIEAVKEEVSELVDEEQRILAAIMSRRKKKVFNGTLQIRQYSSLAPSIPDRFKRPLSTAAPSPRLEYTNAGINDGTDDLMDELDVGRNNNEGENFANGKEIPDIKEFIPETEDPLVEGTSKDAGLGLEDDTIPDWLSFDLVRQKCIRKLAVKQLAIRFLLRPAIAHSYMGLRMSYHFDYTVPQMNVNDLIEELNSLRKRIRQLKTTKDAYIDDLAQDLHASNMKELSKQRSRLDQELRHDTEEYLDGKMSLPELLLRLANNLLQASDPDRPYAMRTMLTTFAKARQNDLGDLVLKAMLPNKFPLNSSLILSIMHFYRKSKNLKGFDLFLEMIRGDRYPVDMQQLGYYRRAVINGVEISVPPVQSANAVTWSTLIICCLRFDQPDRADAYLQAARQHGYMDDFTTLNTYLRYYAIRSDWDKGLQAMKRALAYMASSTEHREIRIERLIARMVHLCDECERYDVSDAIISAAMDSGFDPTIAQKQRDIEFSADPELRRWHVAGDAALDDNRSKPLWERIYAFVNEMSQQINSLSEKRPANQWQKLMDTYSQEVLSAVHSGIPDKYKVSGRTHGDSSKELLNATEQEKGQPDESIADVQQQEINSLKDEVAQLKRMVFELTTKTASNGLDLPESSSVDLGHLKTQLSTARPVPEMTPRKKSVRVYR